MGRTKVAFSIVFKLKYHEKNFLALEANRYPSKQCFCLQDKERFGEVYVVISLFSVNFIFDRIRVTLL